MRSEIINKCETFTTNDAVYEKVDVSKYSSVLAIGISKSGGASPVLQHSDGIVWTDCVDGTDVIVKISGTKFVFAYIGNLHFVRFKENIESPVIIGFDKTHQP